MAKGIPWTTEDDRLLKLMFGEITARQLGAKLGRTHRAVQSRAWAKGLTKPDQKESKQ